ncbi:RagB/SusD family nutrient uptake outer membrane protein [Polaribacter batillariae]|uniref:RagB/SusD family nutrient uptake outer membrane protein n=1 Tax=Polaribacter batillariae TaxID=2808900 RepID=A0ABX7SVA0_9FLAO|nr:RagB/SusD family nutrient uptake outer membrane protein [Polaribacter batillariae]QTD37403.1 RagB/SusD family nutrient uptake outer membrane protein [Polaribacter batillariae]
MKNYKFTLLLIFGLIASSCDLEEEPPFLANENVYSTASTATSALIGMYQSLITYDYYGNEFMNLTCLNSGFGVTKRGGQRNTNIHNTTTASLKPTSSTRQVELAWSSMYRTIGLANDAIKSAKVVENPVTQDDKVINDVIGQAYFLRAFNYFNLVRMWGEVPLRISPATKETIHLAKSPIKDVYAQIINDVKMAQSLMNSSIGDFAVKPYAADMLLAKVYMQLATAPATHQEAGLNYWDLAYKEAIKVYGAYSLYPSYAGLFEVSNGNNTSESIFELQSSEGASSDHIRAFTPSNFSTSQNFGWLQVNSEVYDLHATTYPNDPRIESTYLSEFINVRNGKPFKLYPVVPRSNNFLRSFPYFFKLGTKNPENVSTLHNKNFKIYRYADLLLMLAEISNELQNGEELGYVSEVLARVGLTPQAEYSGGKDSFRKAIMKEYQFELLFEGQDWFTNRRRGYTYFLENVINYHNNHPNFNPRVDVKLETDEATVMYLPIPQIEITTNQLISE